MPAIAIGLVTETSSAHELDSAYAPTVLGSTILAPPLIGIGTPVVTGDSIDVLNPIILSIDLATEADSTAAVTLFKAATLAAISEADSTSAFVPLKSKAVALAAETDSTAAVQVSRRLEVGLPGESDSASGMTFETQPTTAPTVSGSLITSTPMVPLATPRVFGSFIGTFTGVTATIELALEDDNTFTPGKVKTRLLSFLEEADSVFAVGRNRSHAIAIATETDSAPYVSIAGDILATTVESDTGFAVGRRKTRAQGLLTESDTALSFRSSKVKSIGLVSEADTPFAITSRRQRAVALATELDSVIRLALRKQIGIVAEADATLLPRRAKKKAINPIGETDTPIPVTLGPNVPDGATVRYPIASSPSIYTAIQEPEPNLDMLVRVSRQLKEAIEQIQRGGR